MILVVILTITIIIFKQKMFLQSNHKQFSKLQNELLNEKENKTRDWKTTMVATTNVIR